MKSKFLLLILVIIVIGLGPLIAGVAVPPGAGTSGDPYQIFLLDHLLWISINSSSWDSYFEQTANIDASATSGWNDGAGFSTIGNTSPYFTGSYDGQGFTIDGLYIDRENEGYIGIFGEADGATIQNLGATNVDITGMHHVGGLAGEIWLGSTVNNCYVTGSVSGTNNHVGGVTGRLYVADLSNCYSTVEVSGASDYVGGLVGENYGGTVSNCYSRGDVIRKSGSTATLFGAFCGENQATIEYCYSTGSVIYDGDTNPTDKGFVGANVGTPTYINNFFDSETSLQASGTGATPKTTSAMKNVATFTAWGMAGLSASPVAVWDFETNPNNDVANNDYWDMSPSGGALKVRALAKTMDIDDGYPFLGWQNGPDIALPVELSSFTVETTNQGVQCSWTTESEIENLGFILERKTEGTDWKEIASYKTDNDLLGQGTVSFSTDYEFLDAFIGPNTTYDYRLADVGHDGKVTYHSVRTVTTGKFLLASKAEKFTVLPAYPNPFNPSTTIQYGLDRDSKVSIQIYDITGQLIKTLLDTEQPQGWHTTLWNGTDNYNKQVPAGIYMSRISSNNITKSIKLMLLK